MSWKQRNGSKENDLAGDIIGKQTADSLDSGPTIIIDPAPTQTKIESPRRLDQSDKTIESATHASARHGGVTLRAFWLGLLLASIAAAANCYVQALYSVHFLGGVQMPFAAIFGLFFTVLVINGTLRGLCRLTGLGWLKTFSPVELLTVYSMMLMASLVSTLGTENFFLTTGTALSYFTTRENKWADIFYNYIPSWFAPGWDGHTFQKQVIDPLYLGGLEPSQIPWPAWAAMLTGWGIFLVFMYSSMFFMALLFRKQWIENEALAFPLVALPLQMVETQGAGENPPSGVFWANRTMWLGFTLATFFHFLRGMNNYFPDWPVMNSIQGNPVSISFPDAPWNAIGAIRAEIFFGGIGVAYLLTSDLAFSFWFFFFFIKFQYVFCTQLGMPPVSLGKGVYDSNFSMTTFQNAGAWMMMASLLVWTARHHIVDLLRGARAGSTLEGEPFSSRLVLAGLVLSIAGMVRWSWFAGINIVIALIFIGIFLMASLVIARTVVEGGFLFPQMTFSSIEWLTTGIMGTHAIGSTNLIKMSFLQPVLMGDMRVNTMPAFLHVMKLAQAHHIGPRGVRRLLSASLVAVAAGVAITVWVTLVTLYRSGGLTSYNFFTISGPQIPFKGIASLLKQQPGVDFTNWGWMAFGAALVWGMMMARSRFLWFPLHPVGYLVATGTGVSRLWFSFFIGWLVKTSILKFGGTDTYLTVRPFMIGLILGNAAAMVFWMLFGFYYGTQIPFWPA